MAPSYLQSLIRLKTTSRVGLRSSKDNLLLEVPFTLRKTIAERSFSICGPKPWNELPYQIRKSTKLAELQKLSESVPL